MNNQHVTNFFQLNNTFICIYCLFQKNRVICNMSEWMAGIEVFIKFIQVNQAFITTNLRTNKNTPGKISSPGYKM